MSTPILSQTAHRSNAFGDTIIDTDIVAPFEMPCQLIARRDGLELGFRAESIPLSQCTLERHGDLLTIHVSLDHCGYNGAWTIPAAAFDALVMARQGRAA
jgi:hypothetical protein